MEVVAQNLARMALLCRRSFCGLPDPIQPWVRLRRLAVAYYNALWCETVMPISGFRRSCSPDDLEP